MSLYLAKLKKNDMKTKITIKSVSGKILFVYEGENNTIKKTLEVADLGGADLRYSDLGGADLRYSDLGGADLRYSNLENADLRYSDLGGADLRYSNLRDSDLEAANLRGADLRDSDLGDSDLRGANLRDSDLEAANLRDSDLRGADLGGANLPIYCKWGHSIKDNMLNIGCVSKTIEDWKQWLKSDEEFETKRGTQEFKQIEAVIRAYIAYYETLN